MFQRGFLKIVVTVLRWFGTRRVTLYIASNSLRPSRALIHLPSSVDKIRRTFIFSRLRDLFPDNRLDFMTDASFPHEEFSRFYSLHPSKNEGHIYRITPKDIRWYRLIKPEWIEEMQSMNYDLALDFDCRFNLAAAHALGQCGAPLSIGFYHPDYQDEFHNIQIKANTAAAYDVMVFELLNKMICPR